MKLIEISAGYRDSADALERRIRELRQTAALCRRERQALEARIDMLRRMRRDAVALAILTEHYYERGHRRHGSFSL